jgi:hypothetical protein
MISLTRISRDLLRIEREASRSPWFRSFGNRLPHKLGWRPQPCRSQSRRRRPKRVTPRSRLQPTLRRIDQRMFPWVVIVQWYLAIVIHLERPRSKRTFRTWLQRTSTMCPSRRFITSRCISQRGITHLSNANSSVSLSRLDKCTRSAA